MEEEEDVRREAAIAATPSLQPNFKSTGVTEDRLSKFRELHRMRLQIKRKSKQKRWKDDTIKSQERSVSSEHETGDDAATKDFVLAKTNSHSSKENLTLDTGTTQHQFASKKRQKLHWGLDVKERWERKSNM